MRLRQIGLNSSKVFANQGLLEGASTYKLEIGGHDILDKKKKVKFDISTHRSEGLIDYVHTDV